MTTQNLTITHDNAFSQPWIVTTGDWEAETFSTLEEAQEAFPDAELDDAGFIVWMSS